MSELEFKKNKENYNVRVSFGKKKGTVYHNIITKDPNKIAQVLIDLEIVDSFPIEKAVEIYLSRKHRKDWMGL